MLADWVSWVSNLPRTQAAASCTRGFAVRVDMAAAMPRRPKRSKRSCKTRCDHKMSLEIFNCQINSMATNDNEQITSKNYTKLYDIIWMNDMSKYVNINLHNMSNVGRVMTSDDRIRACFRPGPSPPSTQLPGGHLWLPSLEVVACNFHHVVGLSKCEETRIKR